MVTSGLLGSFTGKGKEEEEEQLWQRVKSTVNQIKIQRERGWKQGVGEAKRQGDWLVVNGTRERRWLRNKVAVRWGPRLEKRRCTCPASMIASMEPKEKHYHHREYELLFGIVTVVVFNYFFYFFKIYFQHYYIKTIQKKYKNNNLKQKYHNKS